MVSFSFFLQVHDQIDVIRERNLLFNIINIAFLRVIRVQHCVLNMRNDYSVVYMYRERENERMR